MVLVIKAVDHVTYDQHRVKIFAKTPRPSEEEQPPLKNPPCGFIFRGGCICPGQSKSERNKDTTEYRYRQRSTSSGRRGRTKGRLYERRCPPDYKGRGSETPACPGERRDLGEGVSDLQNPNTHTATLRPKSGNQPTFMSCFHYCNPQCLLIA